MTISVDCRFAEKDSPRADCSLLNPILRFMARLFLIALTLTFGWAVGIARAQSHDEVSLEVGAAAVDITPPIGAPMAGYYSERGCTGVHDPLFAKAMVIRRGEQTVALVSLDLIKTTPWICERAWNEIEKRTDIPAEAVMISATHSHTGPILAKTSSRYDSVGGRSNLAIEYTESLPNKIADAVENAVRNLQPALLQSAIGRETGLAFNRRFQMIDGTTGWNAGKMNPRIVRPVGPVDDALPIVYASTPDKTPIATYINFAMHLDTVGGTEFSADAPYTLCKLLGNAHNAEMVTLFTAGCCGDVNHINVKSAAPQKGNVEAARIGTRLAAETLRTLEKLEPISQGSPNFARWTIDLPLPEVTEAEVAAAEKIVAQYRSASGVSRPKFLDIVGAFKTLDVAERAGLPWNANVQVIAIGPDLAWVALPGEIFTQLGLAIKESSPFRTTIVVELANGSLGYIPNRIAYPQGNYEVVSSRCAAGSGEMLVDTALDMLREAFVMVSTVR